MYTTPESVIAAGVIIPTLASTAVFLRFHARLSRKQGIGRDDWVTLVGLVSRCSLRRSLCDANSSHKFLTWCLSIVVIVGMICNDSSYFGVLMIE